MNKTWLNSREIVYILDHMLNEAIIIRVSLCTLTTILGIFLFL